MVLNKTHSRRTVTRRALLVALVPSAAALLTLAALRPGVKAQAAPTALADGASHSGASVAVPSEGSRLNFNFGPGTNFVNHGNGKMDITTGPDLTINSTTFLAGMSDASKPGSPWWSATGALLPTPVYDTNAYHTGDHVGDSSTHNVSFAFRLPPTASGITTQFKLPQSKGYSSDGAWPGKSQSDAQHTESQMFASTGGARIVTAAFPPALKKTSIQIGIAAGPWKTAASNPNPSSAFSTNNGDQGFILGAAEQTATGLVLTLTTNSTDDLRVVARDMQGNELLPADNLGGSINGMDQITVHFSQPLSQIKVFEVQTRPFVWIGFRDIALQPVQNSAAVSSAEGQTPWTSVRLTQNEPGEVSHTEVRITPTVPGTHPDPPVTGKLVDGPGQFSSLSITPWKYDKAHSLGVKFTYTPSRTDKTDPATIHLLTKTGVVAAVIRYYPAW